jgi:hypothetical protein
MAESNRRWIYLAGWSQTGSIHSERGKEIPMSSGAAMPRNTMPNPLVFTLLRRGRHFR